MLTIPETIKTLFRTDSVHKNFRASFPNGELPDITNSSIIEESLEFTESVCSGDVFRFGLAEASVIRVETVGVPNMMGMQISCGIEIDTSSLSAAQLAAIAADPGDGVLVQAADSDIGHGYYRVPLGDFIVDSCPRNHEAMTRRKVTAYSVLGGELFPNSPFEAAKLRTTIPAPVKAVSNYAPSIPLLVYAGLGWFSPSILDGFTKTALAAWSAWTDNSYTATWYGGSLAVSAEINSRIVPRPSPDALYQLEMQGWDSAAAIEALDWIENEVDNLGGDGAAAKNYIKESLFPHAGNTGGEFLFTKDLPVYYPYFITDTASQASFHVPVVIPYSAVISVKRNNVVEATRSIPQLLTSDPAAYQFTVPASNVRGDFPPSVFGGPLQLTFPTFRESYDYPRIAEGWLELSGQFCRPTRGGSAAIFSLDNSDPTELGPADFESVWWDEYDVDPVGAVIYRSGGGADAQEVLLEIGDGGSAYDLQNNYVLQILGDTTPADVLAMIEANLLPALGSVGFTPVAMTMRAWPWLQAGDALEITAADGTVVNTFALTRTMKGVQLLMDEIRSSGGLAIEEE